MIVSKFDYKLNKDEHAKVEAIISNRTVTLYCKKEDEDRLHNMVLAIQRLISRFSFKFSGSTPEDIMIFCLINILSSKNIDEILEKTDPNAIKEAKKEQAKKGFFPEKSNCCKKEEERLTKEFIEVLKEIEGVI